MPLDPELSLSLFLSVSMALLALPSRLKSIYVRKTALSRRDIAPDSLIFEILPKFPARVYRFHFLYIPLYT